MELTMQEKLRLIDFFEFQLDKEVSKPLDEMDTEAIDAYVNVLLDLQDKHIELSPDFITEQVRKIFREEETTATPEAVKTTKKYFNKKKVWLIAACIAILVALFSIISVANDWNVFDILSEKFGSVHFAPVDEGVNFNNITVANHGKSTIYTNLEDALKGEKISVLYPEYLPEDTKITDITFFTENSVNVMMYGFNTPNTTFYTHFNTSITNATKDTATEIVNINSLTCYIYDLLDINYIQIMFEYNNNTYCFNHTDKEELIETIKSLKEISYEN